MRTRELATAALFGALVVWGLRALVIIAVHGGWRAPLEGLLLVVGLLLYLAGSIAAGLSVATTRAPGPLVVWGFVGFAAGSVLFFLAQTVLSLVAPSNGGWVWGEAQLWAAAGLALIIWLSVQDGLDAS